MRLIFGIDGGRVPRTLSLRSDHEEWSKGSLVQVVAIHELFETIDRGEARSHKWVEEQTQTKLPGEEPKWTRHRKDCVAPDLRSGKFQNVSF